MKTFRIILALILISSNLSQALAIPLSDTFSQDIAPGWDPIYGRITGVQLTPALQNIDEEITLIFSLKNLSLPREKFYFNHLGIFHWEDGFGLKNQFSGGVKNDNEVSIEVNRTGQYFLAPIIAEEDFTLQASTSMGSAGKPIEITSSVIIGNDGQPIWDGFPFLISTENAMISGSSVIANEVETKGGKIRFTITPSVDGPIALSINTDFGDAGASAILGEEVPEANTPPENSTPDSAEIPEISNTDITSSDTKSFPDIEGHWAEEFIKTLVEKNIVSGYANGNFGPNDAVTRAQLVKIALNAFNYSLTDVTEKPFSDVNTDEWFAPFIATAKLKSILTGYPDATFRPNLAVNRSEGLKIIMSAAGIVPSTDNRADFSDVDQTAWFAPYVNTAVNQGIIQGREQVVEAKKSTSPGGVIFIKENLWPGKTGEEVKKLQTALTIMGHYRGIISGTYDRETLEAVYAFQVAAGIVKTPLDPSRNGSLGEKTRNIFNAQKVSAAPASEEEGETKTLRFFDPLASLSRAEVAKIVVKMMEAVSDAKSTIKNNSSSSNITLASSSVRQTSSSDNQFRAEFVFKGDTDYSLMYMDFEACIINTSDIDQEPNAQGEYQLIFTCGALPSIESGSYTFQLKDKQSQSVIFEQEVEYMKPTNKKGFE